MRAAMAILRKQIQPHKPIPILFVGLNSILILAPNWRSILILAVYRGPILILNTQLGSSFG